VFVPDDPHWAAAGSAHISVPSKTATSENSIISSHLRKFRRLPFMILPPWLTSGACYYKSAGAAQ
jgi:hypothetical protein